MQNFQEERMEKANAQLDLLVSIIKSPNFNNALKNIESDPQALNDAVSDPKGFLKRNQLDIDEELKRKGREIGINEEATVEFTPGQGQGRSWTVCVGVGFVQVCKNFK